MVDEAAGSVRILVIAPDQPGLNTRREVRQIQRKHHMSILDGAVTPEDIYQAVRETAFDIHHYATDSGPEGVALSDGVIFGPDEIAGVARIKETPCLFFNSCNSGRLAAYAVRHGVRYAVHTNIELADADAWKPAVGFYESLQNGHGKDYVGAYIVADSGDGDYGLSVDPEYLAGLERTAAITAALPHAAQPLTRREALIWGVGLALGSAGVVALLLRLAGMMN